MKETPTFEVCHCDETFRKIGAKKVKYPTPQFAQYHDCAYVRKRNALIKEASDATYEHSDWFSTNYFARKMEELVREKLK